MTASSDVHSNALNFLSSIQNGVDPRTGLYSVSIELPKLCGNDLLGPELNLVLRYNALNPQDSGYGKGWNLQLSQYDPRFERKVVSLASGETFKVTGYFADTPQLKMAEKKIDSFHLYEESDSRWRLVHRSGLIEILELKGSGSNRRAMPVMMLDEVGHWLLLQYTTFADGFPLLEKVTDMYGADLLEITRTSARVQLSVATDSGKQHYSLELIDSDRKVGRIELPTDNRASWRFKYDLKRGKACITEVHTPSGAFEQVYYEDEGHLFPIGSGLEPLARITRHISNPGQDQPPIETRYTYAADQHNFLGGNVSIGWENDGLDNLYRSNIDYDYSTTESLWVSGRPVRSIVREFNKFHLITREATAHGGTLSGDGKTVLGNNIQEKLYTYDLRQGSYAEQVNSCQMPIKVETRFRLHDNATQHRSDTVETRYDDYGNITWHRSADGIEETSTWYKAAEEGYPGDVLGFVRHLKQRVRAPAAGHPGNAPTLTTDYRYQLEPVRASSSQHSTLEHWVAQQSETLSSGDVLTTISYSYWSAPQEEPGSTAPLLHSRLRSSTTAYPNPDRAPQAPATLDTRTDYEYRYERFDWDRLRNPSPHLAGTINLLLTEQTTTGHDGTQQVTAQGFSLQIGEMLLDRDVDQVERLTEYDALRRAVREVVAPRTESEAVRSEEYFLCAVEGDRAYRRSIDSQQVVTETTFDGLGRVCKETQNHIEAARPQEHLVTLERQHDSWGREVRATLYDWVDDQSLPAGGKGMTTEYAYDEWGERNRETRPDGVRQCLAYDPTQADKQGNVCRLTWLQNADQTLQSEKQRTWMNRFEKPTRIERLDLDEQVVAEQLFSYDGLGRSVSRTDERGHVNKFEYDAFNRMTCNTLPDATRVERTYAAHTLAELATSIKAISNKVEEPPYTLGTQTYDGLGRMTARTVGKCQEKFEYDPKAPGRSVPDAMITGAGDTIGYTYQLELSPLPTSSTVKDEDASFSYHPITALPRSSKNAQAERKYSYDPRQRLCREDLLHTDGSQLSRHWKSSIQGRLITSTDATEVPTVHQYDACGRVSSTSQGNVQVGFTYDPLGRLEQVTSTDTVNASTLVTRLEYDEHSRESKRTQQLQGQPSTLLKQSWSKDGLIESRELTQDGQVLLKEVFTYDERGRLTMHTCNGSQLPTDEQGRGITQQFFFFDAIDNIKMCATMFDDGTSSVASYTYEEQDRCRLSGLTFGLSTAMLAYLNANGQPLDSAQAAKAGITQLTFEHDANGNLLIDQKGRELRYDSQNRLLGITGASTYTYDGQGQLLSNQADGKNASMLWYEGDRLSLAIQDGQHTRFCYSGDMPLAQQGNSPDANLLLQTSASHSVIAESQAGTVRQATYSAYGQRHVEPPLHSRLGYGGEALDEGSGWYLLGRGYRAYNPQLMRFNSPDSQSPFDSGGLNPYAYCLGNPISLRDPTGHEASYSGGRRRRPDEDNPNWQSGGGSSGGAMTWVWVGIAIVSAIATVVTAGTALAAVGAFGAAAATAVATTAAGTGVFATLVAKAASATVFGAMVKTAVAALAVGGAVTHTMSVATDNAELGAISGYLGAASFGVGLLGAGLGMFRMLKDAASAASGSNAASQVASLSRSGSLSSPMANASRASITSNSVAAASATSPTPEAPNTSVFRAIRRRILGSSRIFRGNPDNIASTGAGRFTPNNQGRSIM
jgi:RHS repeat-associated protein